MIRNPSGSIVATGELRRLFAAAFATDLALYLVYTAVPYKALRLGAGPAGLGLLAAASTGAYALVVSISGRASDRRSRMMLARASCVGVVLACLGMTYAGRFPTMLMCAPLVGASLAFFWPCVQASIADRSAPGGLERNLGRFNLAWSIGKGTGFLCGGTLLAAFGAEVVFTVGSAVVFVVFFVLPSSPGGPIDALMARKRAPSEVAAAGHGEPIASSAGDTSLQVPAVAADFRAPLFRRLAWVANGAAYGVAATLTYHYPRLVQNNGWSPRVFGVFMAGVFFTQTISFVLLMRHAHAWRFRRAPLYVPQLLLAVAIVALPLASGGRLVAAALVIGFALATCYSASIYYSLLGHTDRGRNAGVHESLIGLGSMTVPLLGGLLARRGGEWAPYATAAAAVLLVLAVEEVWVRSAVRRGTRAGVAAG